MRYQLRNSRENGTWNRNSVALTSLELMGVSSTIWGASLRCVQDQLSTRTSIQTVRPGPHLRCHHYLSRPHLLELFPAARVAFGR